MSERTPTGQKPSKNVKNRQKTPKKRQKTPKNRQKTPKNAVKPYFIEAPAHQSAQVGAQVRMRCRMGGDPEPVISWRRQNGQPLSEK